jgi:hypothetical protein
MTCEIGPLGPPFSTATGDQRLNGLGRGVVELAIRLVANRLISFPSQGIDAAHPRSLRSNRDRIRADKNIEAGLKLCELYA